MHCPNCNTEIPKEAKFCPNCGFNFKNKIQSAGNVIISPEINVSPVISIGGEGAQIKNMYLYSSPQTKLIDEQFFEFRVDIFCL